jgi:hypothetical protein
MQVSLNLNGSVINLIYSLLFINLQIVKKLNFVSVYNCNKYFLFLIIHTLKESGAGTQGFEDRKYLQLRPNLKSHSNISLNINSIY